jgi:hypothetical protein
MDASSNRDAGKVFVITEMSAGQGEKWALRALLALGHAGFNFPPDMAAAGMAAMALVGINSLLNVQWHEAEPLLDEMMACIKIKPSPQAEPRDMISDDVEEVATRVFLRKAVWELHVDFSSAAALLTSLSAVATTSQGSSTIQTSQE